jgi:hypothetical protein
MTREKMFCARPKLGYLAYWGSDPMAKAVLHLFVELVGGLEVYTDFHDQGAGVAL